MRLPPFSLARSLVWYDEVVRELFLRLKFNADTSVIPGLCQLISGYDTTEFKQVDWIVPVPLHRLRLRKRGLNQSLVLARMFFPGHGHLLRTDLLVRTKNSRAQTLLSGVRRRRNLRGVFRTAKPEEIDGAVVCLVDDVFTTGTTVAECTRTMLKSGAREVKVLTMARVKVIRG
ncbi:MAG: ComF family protein [Desulforhopalus sp.]